MQYFVPCRTSVTPRAASAARRVFEVYDAVWSCRVVNDAIGSLSVAGWSPVCSMCQSSRSSQTVVGGLLLLGT